MDTTTVDTTKNWKLMYVLSEKWTAPKLQYVEFFLLCVPNQILRLAHTTLSIRYRREVGPSVLPIVF